MIDNEGMGRKKSKGMPPLSSPSILRPISSTCLVTIEMGYIAHGRPVIVCCIYHAPKPVGESSSESDSSSSDDDSDRGGGNDEGKARMGGKGKGKGREKDEKEKNHGEGDHEHDGCDHGPVRAKGSGSTGKRKSRNAYEVQPKITKPVEAK